MSNTVNKNSLEILTCLRKIIRAVDLNSKRLSFETNLTAPQILSLEAIAKTGALTLAELAEQVHLSSSTMVGIVDRLENKNLVERERSTDDRRKVFIKITPEGKKVTKKVPTPLQDKLLESLATLSENQQKSIVKSLHLLVDMLGVKDVKASPILTSQVNPA
jgi:DNA-binding MarR family transcriptional regulator